MFPFFDNKALDAAHFYFGSDGNVQWQEGSMNVVDFLFLMKSNETIHEGSRNATLSKFAGRVLVRYGNTDEARKLFREQAERCEPPLETEELRTIWRSALKFYKGVKSSPDYVAPDKYNGKNPDWVEPIPFTRYQMEPFPIDTLPPQIADYVTAVAESTQTPIDMAGTHALTIMAMCLQTKYLIQGNPNRFAYGTAECHIYSSWKCNFSWQRSDCEISILYANIKCRHSKIPQ